MKRLLINTKSGGQLLTNLLGTCGKLSAALSSSIDVLLIRYYINHPLSQAVFTAPAQGMTIFVSKIHVESLFRNIGTYFMGIKSICQAHLAHGCKRIESILPAGFLLNGMSFGWMYPFVGRFALRNSVRMI